jgi:hypothetical protein
MHIRMPAVLYLAAGRAFATGIHTLALAVKRCSHGKSCHLFSHGIRAAKDIACAYASAFNIGFYYVYCPILALDTVKSHIDLITA